MVALWPFDEKLIDSDNTKMIDAVVFTSKLQQNIYIIFHINLKNIGGKRTLPSVDSETTRSFKDPKKTEDERKKRRNTMTKVKNKVCHIFFKNIMIKNA